MIKKNKGITLMEIMITMGILAIISIPLYYILADSNRQANLVMARDAIKQESNKILKILETDLTQARKGTYKEESNGDICIKVRKDQKHDAELKYSFDKSNHKLSRYYEGDGKSWKIVSNKVDNFEVTKAIDETPGKMTIHLVMKSNLPGLKNDEQPLYEQNKIIVMMEDATEENDPYWREVGDINSFFQSEGNLLAGLKEDSEKMIQDLASVWEQALGDIKKMSIDELLETKNRLQNSLNDLKDNINEINQQIKDLDWEALYDSGFLGIGNGRKKRKANRVKELVSGYKSLEEMNWNQVKSTGSGMKEEAIKAMFDSKVELFKGQNDILSNISKVDEQLDKNKK